MLAERSGMPISTLSKLETGKAGLSADKLLTLSSALDIDVASLFENDKSGASLIPEAPLIGRRSVTLAGADGIIETSNYDYALHAKDLILRVMHPMMVEVKARSIEEYGELSRHIGEEWTCVLEGRLEFHSEYYAPQILNAGDSVYFDSSMGHAYINASEARCMMISVSTQADRR